MITTHIYIRRWIGRLANNIQQLHNAILIALHYNYTVLMPSHPFFNKTTISLHEKPREGTLTNGYEFYYPLRIHSIDHTLFEKNKEEALKILKSCFTIDSSTLSPGGENDLLIHIRAGDVFKRNPHSLYYQPPLSFYVNLLRNHTFDSVRLIAEDERNPCIGELMRLFPAIKYQRNSLEVDVTYILSAKQIVTSNSTFIPELLKLSSHINTVYKYDCPAYSSRMYPWKNSVEQRNLMMTYSDGDVILEHPRGVDGMLKTE